MRLGGDRRRGECGKGNGGSQGTGPGRAHAALAVFTQGRFGPTGGLTTIQVESLTCLGTSVIAPTVSGLGLSPITVVGEATLSGTLQVTDLGAAVGTYPVLTAQSIQGAFDTIQIPAGWSWGENATSVWVVKGIVPVEPSTWGELKSRY